MFKMQCYIMATRSIIVVSCSEEFETKIKNAAGKESVSSWIRDACEQRLEREKKECEQ